VRSAFGAFLRRSEGVIDIRMGVEESTQHDEGALEQQPVNIVPERERMKWDWLA
jgi:hypothetical protein